MNDFSTNHWWAVAATQTIVLTIASVALGQTWTKQSPYPANDDLRGVHFISDDVGFVVGVDNILMQTTDGGTTWTQAPELPRDPSGIGYDLDHVQFVTPTHGHAMGGRAYLTTDGGATWQQGPLPLLGSVIEFDFVSTQRGWAWNRRAMMTTDNGGLSWDINIEEDLSGNFIYDVDFFSENLAILVGELNSDIGVFRSTNGGESWQKIADNPFQHVVYLTNDVLLAANTTTFSRSTDGGVTWTIVHSDVDPLSQVDVESLCRIDSDSAAAIGFDARIWLTNDAGETWQRVKEKTGLWGFGWDIRFPTEATGYAVGSGGLIFKSSDAGQTWVQINRGSAHYVLDIVMRPDGLGLAVGQDGTLLRTTDFGQMWYAKQIMPTNAFAHISELNTIEFADDDTVYVGGEHSIFRSDDAGVTWTKVAELGGNAECLDLFFFNEDEGFACGILNAPRGFIDYTNDGGQTWERRLDGDPYPVRLHMFDAMNGRSLITSATNLFTENAFVSTFFFILPGDGPRYHMEYGSDEVGWYVGPTANLLRTTDAALSFQAQTLPGFFNNGGVQSDWLTDLRVLSPTNAYVSTYQFGNPSLGTIYATTDGTSWTALAPIVEPARMSAGVIGAFDVLDSGEIWAAGGDGYIFNSGIPEPPMLGDLDNNDVVDVFDVLMLFDRWGTGGTGADLAPPMDVVDVFDLLEIFANWS